MKKAGLIFLALLVMFSLSACKESDGETTGGEFKEPYSAYGIKKGEESLGSVMYEKPPQAIAFQPFLLRAFKPEGVPLEWEEIVLEKGESANINIDEAVVFSEENNRKSTGYLMGQVNITFELNEDGTFFTVSNKAESKTLHQRAGMPDRFRDEKAYDGESIYQIAKVLEVPGVPEDEEFLIFVIGQKGQAGNSGLIICRINGVKR